MQIHPKCVGSVHENEHLWIIVEASVINLKTQKQTEARSIVLLDKCCTHSLWMFAVNVVVLVLWFEGLIS